MASGIFTLKQQEIALSLNAWSGQKTPAVDYLVVAGGGGGAGNYGGGGGGAGGLLQGNVSVVSGTAITVTVGGGGAASAGNGSSVGANGANSVFGSISALGGGGGADGQYLMQASSGGSGGGNGGEFATGNLRIGGQGTAGQGNSGGKGSGPGYYNAGGGGGAGTVGLDAVGSTAPGNGGAGISSDISGIRTAYAGGGGGGAGYSSSGSGAAGGVGGGGAGSTAGTGTAGTANTGGGGGGGGNTASTVGGAGGSGVVIISYPDIYPAPTSTTGSPTVSTSGSGAISFSGTSQYIQYADNAAFDVGSGDFTIEAWVYRTTTGRMYICGQSDSAGSNASQSFGFQINASNQLDGYITSGSTFYNATAATTFPSSTWTHVAFVRDGNTTRIYSGGVQVGTASVTGITANNSSNRLGIGSAGEYVAGVLWNGYITNLRIVKGTCLYPSGTTFTPSTTPLTAVSGTSLLLPALSGSFSADFSTNGFFPAALGDATYPTWTDSSPFSVTGYKNRVYKWTSSGSITF